ncbi:MAG: nitrate reductase cytochrome c-type subunit [Desulfobulbaceae bacterium]|jgi:cytochrome c-type protein NapB|nr:nitrate reductase cytochrome c-type subunit [Desulfobulbaceae bacterium]
MKKIVWALFLLLCAASFAAAAWASTDTAAKGKAELPSGTAPAAGLDWKDEQSAIPRTFVHQPPLIPHAIHEYETTTSRNDCLDCHRTGDDAQAAPPHESHYLDRDGKAGETVAAQWYFCTQCHVGQVDAKPLIENTFQGK